MEPVRYVELLNQRYKAQGFPPYEWTVNEPSELTTLQKPLSECRVSMLTSGGVSHCSMPTWDAKARNDFRLDTVDPEATSADFSVNDSYYDTADAEIDVNTVFPIDRLRELDAEGFIGSVGPRLWSGFMGRIYKRSHVTEVAAPALAQELHDDDIDLFLLVPA
ncbi:MAG: glycine/sarcosine/betaine reductase selenoprotein B family protein [Acidimicrobiales bacterium]|jgi:D-proline reductase (dithiol) PrdB